MAYKRKITLQDEQNINTIAKSLPPSIKMSPEGKILYVRKEVTGAQMIKNGDTLPGGGKINPNMIYWTHVTVKVDHRANLLYRYQADGMQGVQDYVDLVNHFEGLRVRKMLAGQKWYHRIWLWIKDLFTNHVTVVPL